MFAIREERDYIVQDDLNKAVRKLQEAKKHECKLRRAECFAHLLMLVVQRNWTTRRSSLIM